MKKYVSSLATLGVIALFVWYGSTHRNIFQSLAYVPAWILILIIIGKLINVWTTGLFTKWTVEAFTDTLSQGEAFVVAVLTAIGNFFGPLFGGLGIRAIYLKKYHNLSYSNFTATLIGYYQIMFQLNSLIAIIALLLLPTTHQARYALTIFLAWFAIFALLALTRLPPKQHLSVLTRNRIGAFIIKTFYDIEDSWKVLISRRKLLIQTFALAVINLLTLYLINYAEFDALHIHTSLTALALYTAIVQATLLLSVTPGAIGIREALLILLSGTLAINNQDIIQIAVLDRGTYFLILFVLFMATRHSKLRQSMAKPYLSVNSD